MDMNTKTRIHSVLAVFLPLAAIMLAGSCTVHEQEYPDGNGTGVSDAPVVIRASESLTGSATRAGEDQKVTNRDMLFTYPSSPSGEMKSALCKFDKDGYGYVYADNTGEGEALKWKDIYTDKPGGCVVYLDNLLDYPVQVPNTTVFDPVTGKLDPMKYYDNFNFIYFGPGESKKGEKVMVAEAGSEDALNGIDIVWGRILKAEAGKSLHFEQKHYMSQLTFRFYSEDEELQNALETDKDITVTLMGVQRSLTRQAGNPQLPSPTPNLPPFRRTDGKIENTGRSESDNIIFADQGLKETTETDGTPTYYASKTMVLPPFEMTTGHPIPKLKITIREQDYIGALPNKIDYTQNGKPAQLDYLKFMSGYHTVFNVKLINEWGRKEILFQNVKVNDWIRAYDDEVDLSESGINTWEDLENLAAVYNEDSSENNLRLMKYGTWNGKWEFILWKDIEVDRNLAPPTFDNGNFGIDLNGKKIKWGTTEITTEEDFKNHFVKQQ